MTSSLPFKIKYLSNDLPEIIMPNEDDIGIDFYANEEAVVTDEETVLIGIGIAIELPKGYALILKDRSSNSKYFQVLAGVIDRSFRGEIKVRIKGVYTPYKINRGDKIVQGLIVPDLTRKFYIKKVDELSQTQRNNKGFGSTGK